VSTVDSSNVKKTIPDQCSYSVKDVLLNVELMQCVMHKTTIGVYLGDGQQNDGLSLGGQSASGQLKPNSNDQAGLVKDMDQGGSCIMRYGMRNSTQPAKLIVANTGD